MPIPILFNPRTYLDVVDTLLPDFVLGFAFFTAVIYAALQRRIQHQRSAIAVAAALGAALAIGLVWWEQTSGLSIRNLGPIAVGFALILLASVIHQSLRGIGGSWAGAGIAIGACILVGWAMGFDWPVDREVVQAVMTVALTVGVLAFLLHRRGISGPASFRAGSPPADVDDVRHDMRDLTDGRHVAERLTKGFRRLRKKADSLHQHPEDASDIMLQLRRMLPAEGWLTGRMARLRERAQRMQRGHVARIEEIQSHISRLSPIERRQVASELSAHHKEFKLDQRILRLDKSVAACELRIRDLTQRAQRLIADHDHKQLTEVLEAAKTLQHHNAKLIKAMERTEARLLAAATRIARKERRRKAA